MLPELKHSEPYGRKFYKRYEMKKWLSVAALVLLCLAPVISAACGGEEEEGEEGVTELKWGVGLPMVGYYGAIVGVPAKYAWSLAVDDIGEFTVGGEQYRWKLIFEDNLATVAGGVSSTNKFIYEHHVDFMHQATASPGLAAEPICKEKGIILDTSAADPENFTLDTPQFFQIAANWAINIPPFFDWLSKEHPEVKRVAYCAPDDNTGDAIADAVDASALYYGLEIVAPESYPVETVEFYPIATKIMTKDPDLALVDPSVAEIMWDMGYEGLSATPYWIPSVGEQVGWDRCQGYLIMMPIPIGGLWPEAEALVVEYEDRYGVELTAAPSAFWGMNIIYVLTDALRQAGTVDDMDKIIETMETKAFDSLVGPISFGGEALNGVGHLAIWPSPIYEVVGEDEYRVITVYTPEETEAIMNKVYRAD
jgi:branched-chain amino acid transport system substrate-binding protein